MATEITAADPTLVLELLAAFRKSKLMFAAVSLGVFDALSDSPHSAESLSEKLATNIDATERLLDACVGLGLLKRDDELYRNTAQSQAYLTSQSPSRMTGYIQYSNQVMWQMWGNLEGAIREGTHRWKETFGCDEPIFANFFRTEEAKREFLMGMNGFGVITSPTVVNAIDLSRFKRIVDLGGATGHLVIAALKRYPQMSGVVFDLPGVTSLAHEVVGNSGVQDRIEIVGGDFFQDPLPAGDLYALGRILHDWSQEKIEILLKKIYGALPDGGGLFIGEKMLWEDKSGPAWAQLQDVNMLICTEGRERTLSEYDRLLQAAGFRNVIGARTDKPLDAILAIK